MPPPSIEPWVILIPNPRLGRSFHFVRLYRPDRPFGPPRVQRQARPREVWGTLDLCLYVYRGPSSLGFRGFWCRSSSGVGGGVRPFYTSATSPSRRLHGWLRRGASRVVLFLGAVGVAAVAAFGLLVLPLLPRFEGIGSGAFEEQ